MMMGNFSILLFYSSVKLELFSFKQGQFELFSLLHTFGYHIDQLVGPFEVHVPVPDGLTPLFILLNWPLFLVLLR